ncbi:MAG: hypothetical protein WA432_03170 [Candidatus Babeliaceae bacterium]
MNQKNPYFLLLLSAFLYGISFIFPLTCYVCIFFSFSILFFVQVFSTLSFFYGFMWGWCAFVVHTVPLFCALVPVVYGKCSFFIGWLVVISYGALYAGGWFFIVRLMVKKSGSLFLRFCVVLFLYLLFFEWMSNYCLWIFDYWEGYVCFHPVLLAIHKPLVQKIVLYSGLKGGLLVIGLISCLGTYAYYRRSVYIGLIFCCFLLLTVFPYQCTQKLPPAWFDEIGYATVPFCSGTVEVYERIAEVTHVIRKLLTHYPSLKTIIMPESTFPFSINKYPFFAACFVPFLKDDQRLLVGAYRSEGEYVYNSCYCIGADGVHALYDKQHRMFFLERIPTWFNYRLFKSWFLKDSFYFQKAEITKNVCWGKSMPFKLLICSDIFFNRLVSYADPVICLVNDAWFKGTAIPELLYRRALMQAIISQNDLVYVSYTRALFIDRKGGIFPLIGYSEA